MEQLYDIHNTDNDTWIRGANLAQVLNNIALAAENHGFVKGLGHPESRKILGYYWWSQHYEIFAVDTTRTKVVNNATVGN